MPRFICYLAYVPDLPGCVATGQTVEDTERRGRTLPSLTPLLLLLFYIYPLKLARAAFSVSLGHMISRTVSRSVW